jgi:hypothetical protein
MPSGTGTGIRPGQANPREDMPTIRGRAAIRSIIRPRRRRELIINQNTIAKGPETWVQNANG